MKKLITLALFTLGFIITLKAQLSKGTVFVGTTIGTSSYASESDNLDYTSGTNINRDTKSKTYAFSVGPLVGVFVTNHLVVGGTINYSITHRKSNETLQSSVNVPTTAFTNTTTYTVNIGPFARYYFYNKPTSRNAIYLQVNATAGTGNGTTTNSGVNVNSSYTTDGQVSNITNWNAGTSLGLTHFFSHTVGMDVAFGYTYTSSKSDNNNNTTTTTNGGIATSVLNNYNETTLTNGLSFGVGFHWYFKHRQPTEKVNIYLEY
jgi:hypothetical protein